MTNTTMKASALCFLVFIQLHRAHSDLVFKHLSESQTLRLSCSSQQDHGLWTDLHLYHRSSRAQTTLMSITEGHEVRVDPLIRARLQLHGGLSSHQVNVSISDLQTEDTGLYVCEQRYRTGDTLEPRVTMALRVFLLVDGTGRPCRCSHSYTPLSITIFTTAGFLLLALSWFIVEKCVKRPRHKPQPPTPIYEEMTRKQQSATNTQNNPDPPSHLEEVNFPVYANPNIHQQQENYYSCPRQLALRA